MQARSIQAAIVRSVGAPWTLEEVQLEAPREDEILIKMVGVGICHTDLLCRTGGFPAPTPIVLGHEGAGIVETVGSKVTRVKPGDHVVLSFDSCGHCRNCRQDNPTSDGSSPVTSKGSSVHASFFGQSSFARHAIAREVNAVVVDKALPLEILGPLGCGVQTGAGAIANSMGLLEGDSLAIFGAGAVGLSALLAARALMA